MLFFPASLQFDAQERRWVENRDASASSILNGTDLIREFLYQSEGLLPGEVVAVQVVHEFVKSDAGENTYQRKIYVAMLTLEDLTNSVPDKRFRGFLDWGFWGY